EGGDPPGRPPTETSQFHHDHNLTLGANSFPCGTCVSGRRSLASPAPLGGEAAAGAATTSATTSTASPPPRPLRALAAHGGALDRRLAYQLPLFDPLLHELLSKIIRPLLLPLARLRRPRQGHVRSGRAQRLAEEEPEQLKPVPLPPVLLQTQLAIILRRDALELGVELFLALAQLPLVFDRLPPTTFPLALDLLPPTALPLVLDRLPPTTRQLLGDKVGHRGRDRPLDDRLGLGSRSRRTRCRSGRGLHHAHERIQHRVPTLGGRPRSGRGHRLLLDDRLGSRLLCRRLLHGRHRLTEARDDLLAAVGGAEALATARTGKA